MTLHHITVLIALLATAAVGAGCGVDDRPSDASTDDQAGATGISIQGLANNGTLEACAALTLNAESASTADASMEYAWNVTAPQNAQFDFSPDGSQLRFSARTPGEYLVSATVCSSPATSAIDCAVTEFALTVQVGADLNDNGVGDQCEAANCIPACEGRTCGLDPICQTSCGSCGSGQECDPEQGQCKTACIPACEGRTCGLDPICQTSCGTCGSGQTCDEAAGQCQSVCIPACDGRSCGLDPVCHTSCGTCADGTSCNSDGKCEVAQKSGRVVTLLMKLTDRRLAFTDPLFHQRARLIQQSVRWVSSVDAPSVLVVQDDNSGSSTWDSHLIVSALKKAGLAATLIQEPTSGLRTEQLNGIDVVWFSNPSRPIDDTQSIKVLETFVRHGGGVVLQGDDIAQGSEMSALTRLRYVSNGDHYCGQYINDDRGASYEVKVEKVSHPVTTGLSGNRLYYGDDIDNTTVVAAPDTTVLAWASIKTCRSAQSTSSSCPKLPVIVAYTPKQ